jgi:hypothetical protein
MSLRTANVHFNIFYLYTKLHIYKNGQRLFWLLSTYLLFNIYILSSTVVLIGTLPPPHPQASVSPLWFRGHTLACEIGIWGGGVPIRTRGQKLLYSRYGLYFVLSSYSISARNSVKSVKISKPPPPLRAQVPIILRGNCNNWYQVTIFK